MENSGAVLIIGYALATIGPSLGIAVAVYSANMASARQPELAGRFFTNFIVGAALVEALALIGFVLTFLL